MCGSGVSTGGEPSAMPVSPQRERNQAAAGNNQRNRSVQSELTCRTREGDQRVYGPKQHPSLSSAHPASSSVLKYTVCAELHVNRSPAGSRTEGFAETCRRDPTPCAMVFGDTRTRFSVASGAEKVVESALAGDKEAIAETGNASRASQGSTLRCFAGSSWQ